VAFCPKAAVASRKVRRRLMSFCIAFVAGLLPCGAAKVRPPHEGVLDPMLRLR